MGQLAAVAAERSRALEALHVVHGLGPGLRHGHELALLLHHLLHLSAEGVHPGLQVGLLGGGQPLDGGVHPLKQPRVAQRRPGDHHAVAAGLLHHGQSVLGGVDVAVAQHGNLHGLLHPADDVQINARGVHLLPGAGVDGHQHGARLLAGFGALHGRHMVGVPALAHFHGHGPGGVGHHLLHDLAAGIGVQHQLAASAPGDDLRGRAAHVDVQKIKIVLLDGGGGLPHDLGHLAKDLHAVGRAVGLGFQKADGFVVAVHQRPAGYHLADGKACAMLGHQAAARRIGKACHGAEDGLVGQGEIANFQRFHSVPRFVSVSMFSIVSYF